MNLFWINYRLGLNAFYGFYGKYDMCKDIHVIYFT